VDDHVKSHRRAAQQLVRAVEKTVLSARFSTEHPADAFSAACILRAARLINRGLICGKDGDPEGQGLLARGAFEMLVQGIWVITRPENILWMYGDHQRCGRVLIEAGRDEGEIDTDTAAAALKVLDAGVPDKRLPSIEVMLKDVSEWAHETTQVVELAHFTDLYRRAYRPLSLFDVHGFSPVERYWQVDLEKHQIELRRIAAPFLEPDEATLLMAGLTCEVAAVVFKHLGIDHTKVELASRSLLRLAADQMSRRTVALSELLTCEVDIAERSPT
jgi:hypothetical protein